MNYLLTASTSLEAFFVFDLPGYAILMFGVCY